MKLLLKVYLEDINPYDTLQLLDVFKKTIVNSGETKVYLTSNDFSFDYVGYDFTALNKVSVPQMINYKLNELEWDLVLPITRPCIISYGFDVMIGKKYKDVFKDLDGVLCLNDVTKSEKIIKYPVVGRKYYESFGYLYNPAYNKKNFEEEFTEVAKYSNKVYFFDKNIIKSISLPSDDDKIYEMRKKLNFNLV